MCRLRAWRWDEYRTKLRDEQKKSLAEVTVVGAPEGTDDAWSEAEAIATGVEFTRELVAEPANVIYPASFVERCQKRFEGTGAEIQVLEEAEMEKLGMHMLLGVGQGSRKDSKLLVIKWMGGKDGEAPTAFVGKGVTFDTGGISIKPGPGMGDMKFDMGGAGAVAGAMLALSLRKAKANVIGVCGLVENMPDGNAQRPGDVVQTMSGQTVEILNTDAEGRLVLGDALTWTQREFSPARIVDLATLTGAMIISLGNEHGGLFSNNDDLADQLLDSGQELGRQAVAHADWSRLQQADRQSRLPTCRTSVRAVRVRSQQHSSLAALSRTIRLGRTSISRAPSGPTSLARCGTRAQPDTACACSTTSSATRRRDRSTISMRVDFYLLSADPAPAAITQLARKVRQAGEKLLVVAEDFELLEAISQALWAAVARRISCKWHCR